MPSNTLAEAGKLTNDDITSGVIENIVTTNPIFEELPFIAINGNALVYNREKVLGDAENIDVGGTIAAKAPGTYKKKTAVLTTLLGDAEVNGLIQAQGIGQDQMALQIASKAKSVGRLYQQLMITGVAGTDRIDGIRKMLADVVTEGDNPQQSKDKADAAFDFADLDEMLMQVKSKDGQVDFILMNEREIRKFRALERALGGVTPGWTTENGVTMPMYAGVKIYRNDWIPNNTGGGTSTEIFAGNFDDGSQRVGLYGLTAVNNFGISVEAVGALHDRDEQLARVKFYCGLVSPSELGLAGLINVG